MKYTEKNEIKFKGTNMHKIHESKESLLKEAFEHEPMMHKVPKTTIAIRGKK